MFDRWDSANSSTPMTIVVLCLGIFLAAVFLLASH